MLTPNSCKLRLTPPGLFPALMNEFLIMDDPTIQTLVVCPVKLRLQLVFFATCLHGIYNLQNTQLLKILNAWKIKILIQI